MVVFAALFVAFSVVELTANALKLRKVQYVSSPLLMPLLALSIVTASPSSAGTNGLVLAALGFAFLGDLLLRWSHRDTFLVLGLGSFMVCLGAWTAALLLPLRDLAGVASWKWPLAVPFAAYGILVYRLLRPHLGTMRLPVIAYSLVLCAMAFAAVLRVGDGLLSRLALAGSLLFVASDTVLAFHLFRFRQASRWGNFFAALFYIPAQVLLALGLSVLNRG